MKKLSLFFAFCIFAATFVVCATLLESCRKKQCYEPMYDNPPALSDRATILARLLCITSELIVGMAVRD